MKEKRRHMGGRVGSGKVCRRFVTGYAPAGCRSHTKSLNMGRQPILAVIQSRVSTPACTTLLDGEIPKKMQ